MKKIKLSIITLLFLFQSESIRAQWSIGGDILSATNQKFGSLNSFDVKVITNGSTIFDFTTNGDIDYKNSIRGIMHLGRYSFVLPAPAGGTVLKNIRITERGQGQMTVYAENLSVGMYTYSLVADGNIVATKKMICEKK